MSVKVNQLIFEKSPSKRSCPGICSYENMVYIFGGGVIASNQETCYNELWVIDGMHTFINFINIDTQHTFLHL